MHTPPPISLSSVLGLALALGFASLSPQTATAQTIAAGNASLTVSSMGQWRRSIATLADGTMWALIRESDTAGNRLMLHLSTDGVTWTQLPGSGTATAGNGAGAIAAGTECSKLHVAWHALNGGSYYDVYYAVFDTLAAQWDAPPQQLTTASSPNDQYYVSDIQVTDSGHVAVVISTHRAPGAPFTSGWSTGLIVKQSGGTFGAPMQVNTDAYGQRPDAATIGDVVHMAFRTNTGLYGTRYRAFDTSTMAFVTPGDVQVEAGTSNSSCIAADSSGGLWVIYNSGTSSAGSGEVRVAYAAPGAHSTWTPMLVSSDADLIIGNVSYNHFSLTTLDGGLVAAVYSRLTGEQHQNLYYRLLLNGMVLTPETPLATSTDADRYAIVGGTRNARTVDGGAVVAESRAAIHPGRLVEYLPLASAARSVRFGQNCAGSQVSGPRLSIPGIPAAGGTTQVIFDGVAPGGLGALWIGPICQPTPIDLGVIGMPDCALSVLSPATVNFAADPQGMASVGLSIPATTTLNRTPIYMQAIVLAPGANALGVLATNAGAIWFP